MDTDIEQIQAKIEAMPLGELNSLFLLVAAELFGRVRDEGGPTMEVADELSEMLIALSSLRDPRAAAKKFLTAQPARADK